MKKKWGQVGGFYFYGSVIESKTTSYHHCLQTMARMLAYAHALIWFWQAVGRCARTLDC